MDLVEAGSAPGACRHPWETARLAAIRGILRDALGATPLKALDVGCGDGFVSASLFAGGQATSLTCIDVYFTPEQMDEANRNSRGAAFVNDYAAIEGQKFDLVLMLDVVEHEKDDTALLKKVAGSHMDDNGKILLTAPAFHGLMSSHDEMLRHHRRYSLTELEALAGRAGLKVARSGYLFGLLLLPRLVSVVFQKLFNRPPAKITGVGGWEHGYAVTKSLEYLMRMDNAILLAINKMSGIKLPGLSAWALCVKERP
ncbi:MAG: class I SAM-dependent methyltransferase [Nitrospinae bacterium]|nr:class I SAM-dependent methyltransferase [Nitrospinota bacterium]